jgi:hypothetical protein
LESRPQEPKRARIAARRGDEGGTQEKRCPRCLETKARDQFGRRGANGVQPYCRPCSTLNVADWLKRPGNRERHNANIVASKQRTPERTVARKVVSNALATGRLFRGSCVVGSDCAGPVQAHHDDYSKPLDVRWLCRKHHEALHHQEVAA